MNWADTQAELHNLALEAGVAKMLSPEPLAAGVAALAATPGSDEDRLIAAVEAMAAASQRKVTQIEVPDNLEALTVPELKDLADRLEVFRIGATRRDEIISAIRSEARRRARYA